MMSFSKYIKSGLLIILCALAFTTSGIYMESSAVAQEQQIMSTPKDNCTRPLSVVNNPDKYLNKKITMNAKFDKFSTLGLDYKPAMKSSEEYISFLIKRDDTTYDIPLSEMKLFLKRQTAEKFLDLKTNDEIQITGTVFSNALGDAWIDVENLTIIKKAPEKDGAK